MSPRKNLPEADPMDRIRRRCEGGGRLKVSENNFGNMSPLTLL